MVTMAAIALPPPRVRLDHAALKFTAVKVDVSRLTRRAECKAFVISSHTTARDLADMVLHKLKLSASSHMTGTCLLAETPDGRKVPLNPDERALSYAVSRSKKASLFELVPEESVESIMHLSSLSHHAVSCSDVIKAGNLSSPNRNGMTLPGYKRVDTNCNVSASEDFLTSTPKPETDSLASTVDSGFMIHYEPYQFSQSAESGKRIRSKSFELAQDNGYSNRHDLSGNASDSGINGRPQMSGLGEYRLSPLDGFQILQSKNSAWKPFKRRDDIIKQLSLPVMPRDTSLADVNGNTPHSSEATVGAPVRRRRSLPRMSASQEEINDRKQNVADMFANKLRLYMERQRRHQETAANSDKRKPLLATVQYQEDDDATSVTSQEVAEIMSSASPLKPYESEPDSSPEPSLQTTATPPNVFQPLPAPSIDTASPNRQTHSSDVDITPDSDILEHDSNTTKTMAVRGQPSGSRGSSQSTPGREVRGVPLFALLPTHQLAPVMIRRQAQQQASRQFLGVRLCDVTYARCVRHVLKHWETSVRQFTVDAKLADCHLVALGGIDRRTVLIVAGKLFRGDIVVEVNGLSTLQMSARQIMEQMSSVQMSGIVSLVVARSRLNCDRAQSP